MSAPVSKHSNPRLNTDTTLRGDSPSPSPRSASISLQAAATMNAGLQREPTRQTSDGDLSHSQNSSSTRRRSIVLMNVHANDPTVPAPGEMLPSSTTVARTSSPQPVASSPGSLIRRDRDRQPSLGELHQELEAEQEAQVNRLLAQIREQQVQLQQLQAAQGQNNGNQSAIDDSCSVTGGTSGTALSHSTDSVSGPIPRSPSYLRQPRSSFDLARADIQRHTRTPSSGPSPHLRTSSFAGDRPETLSGKDEVALYQAETQMLNRENQMLRLRIRELEKQLSDLNANTAITHEPSMPSHLSSQSAVE